MSSNEIIQTLFEDVKNTLKQFNDIPDVAFGILETEAQILVYFIINRILKQKLSSDNTIREFISKDILNIMLQEQINNLNKLFDISSSTLRNIIIDREKYYNDCCKNMGRYTDNSHKEQVIYSTSFIFYILYADKNSFDKNNSPFASVSEIKQETIKIKNINFTKYDDLEQFYNAYKENLQCIYDLIDDKIGLIIKNYQKKIEEMEKAKKQRNDDITQGILGIMIVFFSIFFLSFGFVASHLYKKHVYNQNLQKEAKMKAEIESAEKLAHKYRRENLEMYENTLIKLSILTKTDVAIIRKRYEDEFIKDKNNCISRIVENKIQNNTTEIEQYYADCLTYYFGGNEKDMEDALKQKFTQRKEEIIKELVIHCEQNPEKFEYEKITYIPTLFNNNKNDFKRVFHELGHDECTVEKHTEPTELEQLLYGW